MKPHRPGLGIALIVLMSLCFAALDSTVKYVGGFISVLLILWVRYCVQALSMLVWLACTRVVSFRVVHPRFQLLRGLLLLTSSVVAFMAVQYLPIAEYTAICMLTPVVGTLFAAWFLHEAVSRFRWALVFGALIGAILVIRPGSDVFDWPILFPLAGVLCYAGFQTLTSKLAALENPFTTHFYTGLIGMVLLTPLVVLKANTVFPALYSAEPFHLGLLLCIGLLATVGHLLMIFALGVAPAAILMPFIYAQIAFAVPIGWLVFRTVPDMWTGVGISVIVVCGAASAWLNVREASPRRPVSAVTVDTSIS